MVMRWPQRVNDVAVAFLSDWVNLTSDSLMLLLSSLSSRKPRSPDRFSMALIREKLSTSLSLAPRSSGGHRISRLRSDSLMAASSHARSSSSARNMRAVSMTVGSIEAAWRPGTMMRERAISEQRADKSAP